VKVPAQLPGVSACQGFESFLAQGLDKQAAHTIARTAIIRAHTGLGRKLSMKEAVVLTGAARKWL
jgi:hypothetical protein